MSVRIAWYGKHFGEEPPLVGDESQGSGTIFFSKCNLKCCYCQNYQISQENLGKDYSEDELVDIMIDLQKQNAVNINLVTPTIWWQTIVPAIKKAKKKGLTIPIVWNSNGYENVEVLKNVSDVVDIFLPDFKYGFNELGQKYSGVHNYTDIATEAIKYLNEIRPELILDENGIAKSGLIVRHLILPGQTESSLCAIDILSSINKKIYVSLMAQYAPIYKSTENNELRRTNNEEEVHKIFTYLTEKGMLNGWTQDLDATDCFVPDFTKQNPFEQSL
ncbi:MAG: Radical SAM domain protein [Parcubacteria group bacterium GW2011_GWC2_39_14]|nr:MAG: Radical SAM domain protein [Parcubacteria group bacterium GW2011_GWC2_39_14]KKR55057.1 MAG: Radical SAM domain protein [Parcubacteria group bacterium GW2011_GWA2_40_23]